MRDNPPAIKPSLNSFSGILPAISIISAGLYPIAKSVAWIAPTEDPPTLSIPFNTPRLSNTWKAPAYANPFTPPPSSTRFLYVACCEKEGEACNKIIGRKTRNAFINRMSRIWYTKLQEMHGHHWNFSLKLIKVITGFYILSFTCKAQVDIFICHFFFAELNNTNWRKRRNNASSLLQCRSQKKPPQKLRRFYINYKFQSSEL